MKRRLPLWRKLWSGMAIRLIKRLALTVIIASVLIPLAGCWDIRYLDKLGVVIALGVDDDPSGKFRYELTVQVVLPQNATSRDGGGNGSPVMTLTEKGDTVFEAIRKMSAKTSRRLFFSHTQLLVIHESTAKKGIFPLMDLIDRNADIRTDISVVIARGVKAAKLLQIRTQMESVPANQIKETILVDQNAKGQLYSVLVRDITRISKSEGQQIAVPAVGVEGDPEAGSTKEIVDRINPKVLPELKTMAVFDGGRLIGYLPPKQSQGLTWSLNKLQNTVLKFPCANGKGHYIMEVIRTGTKVKAEKPKGESEWPTVKMEIRMQSSVHEVTCPGLSINDEQTLLALEEKLNAVVEKEIKSTVDWLMDRKLDALGWGEQIYRDQPALWKQMKARWKTIFPQIQYEIHCISHVESMGARTDAITE
ncbi:Ger(x)C family spore germination protein [Paenibacillus sp. PAMC21692]|uniref:Ger(x)C family spore germination protein n=1 Tax=Paenibacillus sp. PAMC21692 TaxID=2762320 RepID=UPI00164E7976|nr:Ger(x)C family spore germination protein [Paenibacillus sp. PAMC21692]QNK58301.1 Ger(x)C family spore germination protein [Paenibacillus sp. PAMC21692]